MAVLLSSNRKKNKSRSNLRSYGTRHGDQFWDEESKKGNFGLKYMEKCGWSRGDGLGAERQGRKQYIRSAKKSDGLGLGANEHTNDTMYKATVCMFNDILSRLGKKKSDNPSQPVDNSTTDNISASATIRQYEAKTVLWGNFKAGSEKVGASLGASTSISGFTEDDQAAYAQHITSLADSRSGKQGLGFGHKKEDNHRSNPFVFGRFVSSGHISRNDIMNESENAQHLKDATIIDPSAEPSKKKKDKSKKKKDKKERKKAKKKSKPETIAEIPIPIETMPPLATDDTVADTPNQSDTEKTEKKKKKDKKDKKKSKKKRKRKEMESDEIVDTNHNNNSNDTNNDADNKEETTLPLSKKQKTIDDSNNSEGGKKKKKKKNKDKKSKKSKDKPIDLS